MVTAPEKKVVISKMETTTTSSKMETVENKAFEFIKKFEWFSKKAYWDYNHCSIWYWTTTKNCSEVITEAEAKKRALQKIKDIIKHHNLGKYEKNLQIALISFVYNVWHKPAWLDWYVKNWHIKALKNLMKKYKYAWWKVLKWLEKRRQAEVNLF